MRPIDIARLVTSLATPVSVNIFTTPCETSVVDPTDATATYRLQSAGSGTCSGVSNWTWLVSGLNTDVEVRATLNSGTLTSGTTGTWQVLSTTRTWTVARTTTGTAVANVTFEIRRVSDSVTIDTATVTFEAEVTASGGAVDIFNTYAESFVLDPANASATYTLASSGTGSATGVVSWSWLLSGVNTDYEVRATLIGGVSLSSGTVDTWLLMSSSRSWNNGQISIGSRESELLIEIRRASDSVVIDSAIVNVIATVDA